MKQNTFISFGILALLVLALNVVSAAVVPSQSAISLNIEQGNLASSSFTIYNSNLTDNELVTLYLSGNYSALGASLSSTSFNLTNNTNSSAITITVSAGQTTAVGVYTFSILGASSSITVNANVTQSIQNRLCGNDYASNNISIDDADDGNDWDDDWRVADEIEVKVNNLENNADDDYKFDVSLFFFQGNVDASSDMVDDTDDLELSNLRIDEGDDADALFNFKVDGNADGSYAVWVKAENGDAGCYAKKVADIAVDQESGEYAIVTAVKSMYSTASCGDTIELSAEVTNIGEDDSDMVKVNLYNKDLGINTYQEIANLDSGDSTTVNFMFTVPTNAVQKLHSLIFSTEFEYDNDEDNYDSESDSIDDYTFKLNLIDGCVDPTKPTITAVLDSSAKVGKDFNITITIKNNANSSNSFLLTAEGYDAWASSATFVPTAFNLAKQATQTVTLTLSPTQSGAKTFTLKTVYNGKTVEQIVSLNVASKQETAVSNYFANMKDGNVTTWLVSGIVVLIVLILIILLLRLLL